MQRIKEIFSKLKEGHKYYSRGDESYKRKLMNAFEPYFKELESLGVERDLSESLLVFGKEFVENLNLIEDAEEVFNIKTKSVSDITKREGILARKYKVMSYIPQSSNNKAKIRAISYW